MVGSSGHYHAPHKILIVSFNAKTWSTLTKEFSAAARIMQSSSNELSTLVSGKV